MKTDKKEKRSSRSKQRNAQSVTQDKLALKKTEFKDATIETIGLATTGKLTYNEFLKSGPDNTRPLKPLYGVMVRNEPVCMVSYWDIIDYVRSKRAIDGSMLFSIYFNEFTEIREAFFSDAFIDKFEGLVRINMIEYSDTQEFRSLSATDPFRIYLADLVRNYQLNVDPRKFFSVEEGS